MVSFLFPSELRVGAGREELQFRSGGTWSALGAAGFRSGVVLAPGHSLRTMAPSSHSLSCPRGSRSAFPVPKKSPKSVALPMCQLLTRFPFRCVSALEDAVVADLEAGAALDHAVGPVTVGLSPALAHALGLAPPRSPGLPGDPSQSPRLSPDPGPDQDHDPDLEALPLPQRGNPTLDPGLRALPSLRKKKELYPPRLMVMYLGIGTWCMLLYCST